MSRASAHAVLRYIRTLVAGQIVEGRPDESLVDADTALSATVPPLLTLATIKAAAALGAGTPLAASGVSVTVVALAETGATAGSKKALAIAALVLVLGIAGVGGWAHSRHEPPTVPPALSAPLALAKALPPKTPEDDGPQWKEYRARVEAFEPIPDRYMDLKASGKTFDVKPGDNVCDIVLD